MLASHRPGEGYAIDKSFGHYKPGHQMDTKESVHGKSVMHIAVFSLELQYLPHLAILSIIFYTVTVNACAMHSVGHRSFSVPW